MICSFVSFVGRKGKGNSGTAPPPPWTRASQRVALSHYYDSVWAMKHVPEGQVMSCRGYHTARHLLAPPQSTTVVPTVESPWAPPHYYTSASSSSPLSLSCPPLAAPPNIIAVTVHTVLYCRISVYSMYVSLLMLCYMKNSVMHFTSK